MKWSRRIKKIELSKGQINHYASKINEFAIAIYKKMRYARQRI